MKKVLIAMTIGVMFMFLLSKQPYGISYVMSNSIAKGFYFSTKQTSDYQVKTGEITCVTFKQPAWVSERQYLPKDLPLCKKVVAVEGDFIRVRELTLEISPDGINWTELAPIETLDSKGRSVKAYPWGKSTQLKPGEFFGYGDNNQMSLDSRYLGPLKTSTIEKTIKELYVYRTNDR